MQKIMIRSQAREQMIDITDDVEKLLKDSPTTPASEGLGHPDSGRRGVVVLFVQHTTCGLTVNENWDPDVQSDMLGFLRRLIPQDDKHFRHGEQNSDAHIKASLVGSSVTVPFEAGKLCLGRWQGVYLCEFDGPRERKVLMKTL